MRPAGLFVLRERDTPIVAFAGGSGITPVISIIKTALATTTRPILLVYANRSADAVIFAAELERLARESGGRLLDPSPSRCRRAGFLDAAPVRRPRRRRAHADFYVCGPGPYMDVGRGGPGVRSASSPSGCSSSASSSPTRRPPPTPRSPTESVVIRIERREHTLAYQAGDTVLETARRGGLRPPFRASPGVVRRAWRTSTRERSACA